MNFELFFIYLFNSWIVSTPMSPKCAPNLSNSSILHYTLASYVSNSSSKYRFIRNLKSLYSKSPMVIPKSFVLVYWPQCFVPYVQEQDVRNFVPKYTILACHDTIWQWEEFILLPRCIIWLQNLSFILYCYILLPTSTQQYIYIYISTP